MTYAVTAGIATVLTLGLWAALCWKHRQVAVSWRARRRAGGGGAGPAEAQTIREMIRHENELTNHRLTWLLALEGLLFAALGFCWGKDGSAHLIFALAMVGILVAGSAAIVLDAAHTAFVDLDGWWAANRADSYKGPDVCGFRGYTPALGLLTPWRIVPPLFILSWFFILCMSVPP